MGGVTTRARHLNVVPSGPDDDDRPEPDDGVPDDAVLDDVVPAEQPDRAQVAAAAAAHRFYDRVLGPEGTDPDETGDPLLVPHFRHADGALADRAHLERELANVLAAAIGDELDGAVIRLGEHLAEVLATLRMIEV